ncbi:putative U3 small nucleolar ribonucleoprotein protein IMP3 [Neospora caninum Liverpool]|uniref:Putative U3 small nucleolar ribonucleoprotein protein IMP3 n=1 Tax=Neospora caninum (strain Liverpool) TaxID=572307 RepID=F0V845_NEOCL|nr:putative U3 small nucleolar ribonucleoprotein protein IMP3 [Neospora caninum Liverpool]CBZ49886.1 putative U3 small nucleolar ribonucleoprotein protein IMP3 [Neospora caninum Liverpool]CEL64475.1 TPA: U3 small nucleolar ribonucleoprotein protein IMP3, putative [Neospora caninum Liverpool]|eukprot:XP_003879921.1 putative U3 small nucleolar ribonucleoprotein protein IMP3 [Neospora caninum Liverpool]
MRQLKYHEKRLLKKVDFYNWKREQNVREVKVLRRYLIQDREDYQKYNKLCGVVTKLTSELRKLPEDDAFRVKMTELLLDKLYTMGVISKKSSLAQCEGLSASSFCRRRLSVVLVQLKFCEHLKQATAYIEQGHVRIGSEVCLNPALHVTREQEDLIGWSQGSSIQRHVKQFNQTLDDFELLAI